MVRTVYCGSEWDARAPSKKTVFLAPAHYNYVGTCISQFFKRSQKLAFLGETASLKFWASI